MSSERGSIPLAVLIGLGLVVLVFIGLAVCTDAIFEDEDEKNDLGMAVPALMDNDYEEDGDKNKNGRHCEGSQDCSSFSPSFEDSPVEDSFNPTICLPFAHCGGEDKEGTVSATVPFPKEQPM